MKQRARGAYLIAFVAACNAGCVTAPAPRIPKIVPGFDLPAYGLREECMHLEAGERLDYRFEANEPVRFGIEYHEAGATLAPVTREQTRGDAGIYSVPETRDYCLTWEAGPAGARLSYRFVAHPPVEP